MNRKGVGGATPFCWGMGEFLSPDRVPNPVRAAMIIILYGVTLSWNNVYKSTNA
jgi:hypothetical protein